MDPLTAQGRLGLQRHRAAGRGLPGGRPGRPQPEGPARLRHLRPRRAGRRRHRRSPPTSQREDPALRPGRPGRRPPCAASRTSRWAASRWASPARSSTSRSSSSYLGMRVECVDMSEFVRRIEEGIYDEAEFAKAPRLGQGELHGGRGPQPGRAQTEPRAEGPRLGDRRQDGPDRPRPAWSATRGWPSWASARRRWATTPSLAASRASAQWTDHSPNGDFMEAILNSSFDWNGIRAPVHLRDRERQPQRRGDAVRLPAHQHRPRSSPTCAPTGAPRPSSASPATSSTGVAAGGFIHLINSGAATLDGTGASRRATASPP